MRKSEWKKTADIVVDYRGNEVKPGIKVAYNLSGAVVFGIVQSVINRRRRVTWGNGWDYKAEIRVLLDGDVDENASHISVVTNQANVAVVK
jgi:hypothetical protein